MVHLTVNHFNESLRSQIDEANIATSLSHNTPRWNRTASKLSKPFSFVKMLLKYKVHLDLIHCFPCSMSKLVKSGSHLQLNLMH